MDSLQGAFPGSQFVRGAAALSKAANEHPIDAVFVGLSRVAHGDLQKGLRFVLRVSRFTPSNDELELEVLKTHDFGEPLREGPKQVLKIRAEDVINMAIHAPEANDKGDPETPSFIAISTIENTMRYTGYNRTITSYNPDYEACKRINKKTEPMLNCTPFILIVLHKSHEKIDQINLRVSEFGIMAHARNIASLSHLPHLASRDLHSGGCGFFAWL